MNESRKTKLKYWSGLALNVIVLFGGAILLRLISVRGPKKVTPAQGMAFAIIGLGCYFVLLLLASRFWKCPICGRLCGGRSPIGKCSQCGASFW